MHIVQIFSLNEQEKLQWIKIQLQKQKINFEPSVPSLIHYYTEGNMLACSQALEKLLLAANGENLSLRLVEEQLSSQCSYQLFELSEFCLLGRPEKALKYLHYIQQTGTEPSLILWILTQDIRNLLQLCDCVEKNQSFNKIFTELKIWPNKSKLYQFALKHLNKDNLIRLLCFCKTIDERLKLNHSPIIWILIEQLAISFCLGKEVTSLV